MRELICVFGPLRVEAGEPALPYPVPITTTRPGKHQPGVRIMGWVWYSTNKIFFYIP